MKAVTWQTSPRKPSFNCSTHDRYTELINFEMEVTNILEMKAYELNDEEKVTVIKNWLGRKGLQLIKTFTNKKKENARLHDYF